MFLVYFLSVYLVTEMIWLGMENGINMLDSIGKVFKQIREVSEPQYPTLVSRIK